MAPILVPSTMSRQIAVRLPSDLVDFIDALVAAGQSPSRASVVARALERERRRVSTERDIAILMADGDDPDLLALAEYGTRLARPELD